MRARACRRRRGPSKLQRAIEAFGYFGYFPPIMIVTNAPVEISVTDRVPANAGAVVVFVVQGESSANGGDKEVAAAVDRLLSAGAATGKGKEIVFDLVGKGSGVRRVYVAGLGKREKFTAEIVRQSSGAVLRALRKHKISRAAILLPVVKV